MTYSPGPKAMGALVDAAVAKGDVVVSVGGDGMLSSLAGLVAKAAGTLAVVPAGRGNDFARMLGLPEDPAALATVLLDKEARPVDLVSLSLPGVAEPRIVAGSVYCGVDARAGEIVDKVALAALGDPVPLRRAARAGDVQAGPLRRLRRR